MKAPVGGEEAAWPRIVQARAPVLRWPVCSIMLLGIGKSLWAAILVAPGAIKCSVPSLSSFVLRG